MGHVIAVAGKGGVGKTTLCGHMVLEGGKCGTSFRAIKGMGCGDGEQGFYGDAETSKGEDGRLWSRYGMSGMC